LLHWLRSGASGDACVAHQATRVWRAEAGLAHRGGAGTQRRGWHAEAGLARRGGLWHAASQTVPEPDVELDVLDGKPGGGLVHPAAVTSSRCFLFVMMIVVYWYLFSNHYTRECIHTGERERNVRVTSLNSPRALYQPSKYSSHISFLLLSQASGSLFVSHSASIPPTPVHHTPVRLPHLLHHFTICAHSRSLRPFANHYITSLPARILAACAHTPHLQTTHRGISSPGVIYLTQRSFTRLG